MFFLKQNGDDNNSLKGSTTVDNDSDKTAAASKGSPTTQDIKVSDLHYKISKEAVTSTYKVEGSNSSEPIQYISISDLIQSKLVKDDPCVKKILESTTDLIPGVYEGMTKCKTYKLDFDKLYYGFVKMAYISGIVMVLRVVGGFKIWECTFDLITYLESNIQQYSIDENTRILDLGCGSGLLGLYCLRRRASVTFQDFVSLSLCQPY